MRVETQSVEMESNECEVTLEVSSGNRSVWRGDCLDSCGAMAGAGRLGRTHVLGVILLISIFCNLASGATAGIEPPPIYNYWNYQYEGWAGYSCAEYPYGLGGLTVGQVWPEGQCGAYGGCDCCWKAFATWFYQDVVSLGMWPCSGASLLPVDEAPLYLSDHHQYYYYVSSAPSRSDYYAYLAAVEGFDCLKDIPLECTRSLRPVVAAARYTISVGGAGSSTPKAYSGALFFITAIYDETLFEVELNGAVFYQNSGWEYRRERLGSLSPKRFQDKTYDWSGDPTMRDSQWRTVPDYVEVRLKDGRTLAEVGSRSVNLVLHTLNWAGSNDGCDLYGVSCKGDRVNFEKTDSVNVGVCPDTTVEDWWIEPPPMEDSCDAPILPEAARQAAEFEAMGVRVVNKLNVDLPSMRVGHNRWHAGRTLAETLGNDAVWHAYGSDTVYAGFLAVNMMGVWFAVEDVPDWDWGIYAFGGQDYLRVEDTCSNLYYDYFTTDTHEPLGTITYEDYAFHGAKLLEVIDHANGDTTQRTFTYANGDIEQDLLSQGDDVGNAIGYAYAPTGDQLGLTVTGQEYGSGATRQTQITFNSPSITDVEGTRPLVTATVAAGGSSRVYEWYPVSDPPTKYDRKLRKVSDLGGNVLSELSYDDRGRLVERTRGSTGAGNLQTVSAYTYEDSSYLSTNGTMEARFHVNQADYQVAVRTLNKHEQVLDLSEYDELSSTFGDARVTVFDYHTPDDELEPEDADPFYHQVCDMDGQQVVLSRCSEKTSAKGDMSEYTLYDCDFNVTDRFMAPAHITSMPADPINHITYAWARSNPGDDDWGVWQVTQECDVARGACIDYVYDNDGFLIERNMPAITADNSGSGQSIPGQSQTLSYNPNNRRRVDSETRNDGQDNTITVTNGYDEYHNLTTRTESGPGSTRSTVTDYNAFGQPIKETDANGFVTIRVYDQAGHPNNGSGLLLGRYVFVTGDTGPVLRQERFFYFTSGKDTGRLERIDVADHAGPFTLDAPDGWRRTTFAYDDYGRMISKTSTHTTKSGEFVWIYAYDIQDRITQITYPDGVWVRTLRDGRGRVAAEQYGHGGDPSAGTDGTVVLTNTYDYDENGNLCERLNQTAPSAPDHSEYEYDPYNRREKRFDRDDGSVGYDIVTGFVYNKGQDVVRYYLQEGASGPIRQDVRRDIDELGRVWKETTLNDPSAGLSSTSDRISTTTFDVRGNAVGTRVIDGQIGDAVITRTFTCFDFPDTTTRVLNDTQTAVSEFETDNRGNTLATIDPLDHRTEYDYDALSRRTETRNFENVGGSDVLRTRDVTVYTSDGKRAERVLYNSGGQALDRQLWWYDALGRESRWARLANPGRAGDSVDVAVDRVIDSGSDSLGRRTSRTVYVDGDPRTTAWDYDAVGRLETVTQAVAGNTEAWTYHANSSRVETVTVTDELGSTATSSEFDPFGRLADRTVEPLGTEESIVTSYTYDGAGRETSTTDPLSIVTRREYDGIGRLASVTEDFGGDDERTVSFSYRQKGDLHTQTADDGEGPQVTTFGYDRAGRRLSVEHADGSSRSMSYDQVGRMISRQAEDGFVTYYDRDWKGRVLKKRDTDTQGAVLEAFAYDLLGRLTAASVGPLETSRYKTRYVYGDGSDVDGDGDDDPAHVEGPVAEVQTVAGVSKVIGRSYDTAGGLSELEYPAGSDTELRFGRDGFGQVTSIDRNGERLANFEHAGRNVIQRQVRTTDAGTETWVETYWNRLDQLRRARHVRNRVRHDSTAGQGGNVTELLVYISQFDAASNIDHQGVFNSPIANGGTDFDYDRLHRLKQVEHPNDESEEWRLDDLGNWETYLSRSFVLTTYEDNSLNQYTSMTGQSNSPRYDAKGNLVTNERGYGFTYDFENRLTRVFDDADIDGEYDAGETVYAEFVVDALGRRVEVDYGADGTDYPYRFYDGDVVIAEYSELTAGDSDGDGDVDLRDFGEFQYCLGSSRPICLAVFDSDADEDVDLTDYVALSAGIVGPGDGGVAPATRIFINGPNYADEKLLAADVLLDRDRAANGGREGPVAAESYYLVRQDGSGYGVAGLVDGGGCLYAVYDYDGYGSVSTIFLRGDADFDGDVDYDDGDVYDTCFSGPVDDPDFVIPSQACRKAFDFDKDTDVDLDDLVHFVAHLEHPHDNPFYFTCQRLDSLDGGNLRLYDYKRRVYDALHGRFQQRDPAECADGYNLYEYARSNPWVYADPTGEFSYGSVMSGVSIGARVYGMYTTGVSVRQAFLDYRQGLSLRNIMLDFAIGLAVDKVGGKALDFLVDVAGPVVKKVGQKAIASLRGGKGPVDIGKAGEAAAGLAAGAKKSRIPSLTGKAKFRIPDELTEEGEEQFLKEVKNYAGRLGFTGQLEDFFLYAQDKGIEFILVTRKQTKLTEELHNLVKKGAITWDPSLP